MHDQCHKMLQRAEPNNPLANMTFGMNMFGEHLLTSYNQIKQLLAVICTGHFTFLH